jgi:hypothetical protein
VTIRPIPIDRLDLSSKRLAVVGGTNGLGRAIAQQALARGADVTVVGRTLRDDPAARLTFVAADLSWMSEAVRVGRELPAESFDVVLFTTGIIAAKSREETPEHVERDVAISYLSRLAILQGLSDRLGSAREDRAPRPRIFVMGSPGTGAIGNPDDLNSEKDYRSMVAHGNTLAGNEILVLGAKDWFPGPTPAPSSGSWPRQRSRPTPCGSTAPPLHRAAPNSDHQALACGRNRAADAQRRVTSDAQCSPEPVRSSQHPNLVNAQVVSLNRGGLSD